jgi:hypothetical protein
MQGLDDLAVLELWERGHGCGPADRGLLLLAAARPEAAQDCCAETSIADRDAALLALRRATFGPRLACATACPGCGVQLEFELDAAALPTDAPADVELRAGGLRFRLPTSRDLAEAGRCASRPDAARTLLRLCCLEQVAPEPTPSLLAEVEREMARLLDECELRFDCAACGHGWTSVFDICGYFWQEIERRAAGLLDDVHRLACCYGWDEQRILGMSGQRRAAYLRRCDA